MAKKQFKTESKKLLDMMVNSIYTNKEIFLRELISNASDAIDKLYYRSLTDDAVTLKQGDYEIRLSADKEARTLTVRDNGCGMTGRELENNLGTIAKSGSLDFKKDEDVREKVDIIGQFGVGFYSAFMVADEITVRSRAFGEDTAWEWRSSGADGYTLNPTDMEETGTVILLHLRADTEHENYSAYLEEYKLRELVRKYSDYIRYPIRMRVDEHRPVEGKEGEYETVGTDATLNSMIPLWKKSPSDITEEEYNTFYREKFYDFEDPIKVIHSRSEGSATFHSLLFIPAHAPYDYYSKSYEKGLALYSSGVLITEKCADLLPDYFSFVRGIVDSADLSLNISREMLQQDHQLKLIARTVEKKIKNELAKLMTSDREAYEKFFRAFGLQLKFGVYQDFGTHKDVLEDLLLFPSSNEKKLVSLKEYVDRKREEQATIYYACGDTVDAAAMLPQAEAVVARGYEVLYLADDVDEFALRALGEYASLKFANVSDEALDVATEEEKEALRKANDDDKDMLVFMKETLGDSVSAVRFSGTLGEHPVCLGSEGGISLGMEKVLNAMPTGAENKVKAAAVLEINHTHKLAARLRELYASDRDKLANYTKILYAQARLVGGMGVENPTELGALICDLML